MQFIPLGQWPKDFAINPATGFREPKERGFDSVVAESRAGFMRSTPECHSVMKLSPDSYKRLKYFIQESRAVFDSRNQTGESIFMCLRCELNPKATHEIEIL